MRAYEDCMRVFIMCLFLTVVCTDSNAINHRLFYPESDSLKKAKFKLLELRSFEDNIVGYTFESDDKPFADVTFSFRTRIFPFDYLVKIIPKKHRPELGLHFAFTGRLAQYIGTRYSNPVVEKRFNPYLFMEFRPRKKLSNLLFQVGYGHESNGQSIDDSASFFTTANLPRNTVNETKDKISRGWDYIGSTVKLDLFPETYKVLTYEAEIGIRYFLQRGVMQKGKEEYDDWERNWYGENFTRNNVSGILVAFTCFVDSSFINKVRLSYETGIHRPLTASTVKILIGFRIGNFPLSFSYRYGYNGDLAQYGKLTGSFGIESLIPSFQRPEDKRKRRPGDLPHLQ